MQIRSFLVYIFFLFLLFFVLFVHVFLHQNFEELLIKPVLFKFQMNENEEQAIPRKHIILIDFVLFQGEVYNKLRKVYNQ